MKRNYHGSALIELASIAWLVPVIALLCMYVGLLSYGGWACDEACRDAARAAAYAAAGGMQTLSGNGSTSTLSSTAAYDAAVAAVTGFITQSHIFQSPVITVDAFNANFKYGPNGKPTGIDLSPINQNTDAPYAGPNYVRVTLQLTAVMPIPIFNGTGFIRSINFKSSYAFPLTNANYQDTSASVPVPPNLNGAP